MVAIPRARRTRRFPNLRADVVAGYLHAPDTMKARNKRHADALSPRRRALADAGAARRVEARGVVAFARRECSDVAMRAAEDEALDCGGSFEVRITGGEALVRFTIPLP